jgi:hypothetical protein
MANVMFSRPHNLEKLDFEAFVHGSMITHV